jgi:hypothetical protein
MSADKPSMAKPGDETGANELILAADFVLTMDADNRVIRDGAVLIKGRRIGAVGEADARTREHPAVPVRHLRNRLLMPGLINAHCHSGILRGTAESLPVHHGCATPNPCSPERPRSSTCGAIWTAARAPRRRSAIAWSRCPMWGRIRTTIISNRWTTTSA